MKENIIREFAAAVIITLTVVGVSAQQAGDTATRSRDRKASHSVSGTPSRVVVVGPPTTFLKMGLSEEEVVTFLGDPESKAQAWHGGRSITTYSYDRGYGRVLRIEFKEGLLAGYRNETKAEDVKQ
jgi:hypothetical protein